MLIGIDLGGTKIEGIAIEGTTELLRLRVAAPRGDYGATISEVRELVSTIESRLGQKGSVGIGMPGAISTTTGLVKNANSTWLIGKRLDRDLERALGRPVRLSNDANCLALSEATDGAGQGVNVVFGVIIGTGTGGGIVVDGKVLEGRHRIAGEWGHNPLPWPGDDERPGSRCYCGRTGMYETFISGPGLSASYAALSRNGSTRRKLPIGRKPVAFRTKRRSTFTKNGCRARSRVSSMSSTRTSSSWARPVQYRAFVRQRAGPVQPFVFSDSADTPLVRAKHGDPAASVAPRVMEGC